MEEFWMTEDEIQEFALSLPRTPVTALTFEAETMAEIAYKLGLVQGRTYHDPEAKDKLGIYISGFEFLHIERMAEWHIVDEKGDPQRVDIFHVLIVPEYDAKKLTDEQLAEHFGDESDTPD